MKTTFALCLFLTGLSLTSSIARSATLFTPISMDSAQVLPKGVRNLRVLGFTTQVSMKYDGSSSIVPVGQGFNKTVTTGELLDSQPAGFERDKLKGGLRSYGFGMDEKAGTAYGVVNSRITTTAPTVAYGLTDQLTVAAVVPIFFTHTNVRTGWEVDPAWEAKIGQLGPRGFANKLIAFRDQLQNVVNAKIAGAGYKPLEDRRLTELGDVVLGAKYQFAKGSRYAAAISPRLVLPTGRVADVDRLVDVAPGWGTVNAGLAAVYDYSPKAGVTVTPSVSYLYPFAVKRAARVPVSINETLTPDVDRDVTVKSGDLMSANLAARFQVEEAVTVGAGYSFQYKLADSFEGSAYSAERYSYLSKDTEQRLHAAQFSLTYSSIPAFRKKQVALPIEATLGLSNVIAGTNVNKASLVSFDLAAFF
jgi:hypothetical protein